MEETTLTKDVSAKETHKKISYMEAIGEAQIEEMQRELDRRNPR